MLKTDEVYGFFLLLGLSYLPLFLGRGAVFLSGGGVLFLSPNPIQGHSSAPFVLSPTDRLLSFLSPICGSRIPKWRRGEVSV